MEGNDNFCFQELLLFRGGHTLFVSKLIAFAKY
jgi:hypothetical protein